MITDRHVGKFRPFARISFGGLVITAVFLMSSSVAHADPHAMFYTTIGQQQLFFNVLAALDQADYVEPSQFRDALAQKRNEVIKQSSPQEGGITEDPVVAETRSQLSGVLTRPITLEGDDQFTAEVANDYAIEVARRAAVIDLITRVFCHRSLGRDGCENTPNEIARRDFGFVTDPVKWQADAFTQGALGALFSGTEEDKATRVEIERKYQAKEGFQIGRAYNPLVAELRETANQNEGTKKLLDQTVANTAVSMLPGLVNPETFTNLTVDSSGRVDLDRSLLASATTNSALAATGDDYSTLYTQKMSDLLALRGTLREAAQVGSNTIETVANTIEDQGEVGDIKFLPQGTEEANKDEFSCPTCPRPTPGPITGILPTVEVPAAGKIAQLYALANILGILDSTITYATPDTLATPAGRVSLIQESAESAVRRFQQQQNQLDEQQQLQQIDQNLPQQPVDLSQPLVRATNPAGQVAGVITGIHSDDFDAAPPVGVNPVIPHRENELAHVIEALYPGFFGGKPCGCGLETVANDYGTAILAKINSF